MTLSGQKLVRYLLDIGAVDAGAIIDGDLMLCDFTRRHHNVKVLQGRKPGCFVKQAQPSQALSTQSLHREAVCYWLAEHDARMAALKPLLPRYRSYDGGRQILVIELLSQSENMAEYHQRERQFPPEVGALLGQEVGRAHREVVDPGAQAAGMEVFPRAVPWILSIHTLAAAQFDRVSNANAQILALIKQYPEFVTALDTLRAGWRIDGLIHGDMKWENCLLLASAEPGGPLSLKIIDWELADFGDVCWDAGAVFQSYLSAWILSMPPHDEASAEKLVSQAGLSLDAMQPAMARYWHSYFQARQLPSAQQAETLTRCVQYAAARMIQTAYEHMSYAPSISMGTLRMLQVSSNILTRPAEAVRGLLGLGAVLA